MLKPVSILALDRAAVSLATRVRDDVAHAAALSGLVQVRALTASGWSDSTGDGDASALPPYTDLAKAIESIQETRQAPESALRVNEAVSERELVLLVVSAAGPGGRLLLDLADQVREVFEKKGSGYYTVEALCLLPDLFEETVPEDYGAAYSLLKSLSDVMGGSSLTGLSVRTIDIVWLMSSGNAKRVKFGKVEKNPGVYAAAIAGLLMLEPELSGALPTYKARSMDPTFSSFGYAELRFPRETAFARVTARLSSELVLQSFLGADLSSTAVLPRIAAKEFVLQDKFTQPVSRIGVDGGHSIWTKFPAQTALREDGDLNVTLAGLNREADTFKGAKLLEMQRRVAEQAEETAEVLAKLASDAVDTVLDRNDYPYAIRFLEALIDPFPDIHAQAGEQSPRNLITELNTRNHALDSHLDLEPKHQRTKELRAKIRNLDDQIKDQKLIADVLTPLPLDEEAKPDTAEDDDPIQKRAKKLHALQLERDTADAELPNAWANEETEDSLGRISAKEVVRGKLVEDIGKLEEQLRARDLERPKAQNALDDAREIAKEFLFRWIGWPLAAIVFFAFLYAIARLASWTAVVQSLDWLWSKRTLLFVVASIYSIVVFVKYRSGVGAEVAKARKWLASIFPGMEADFGRLKAAQNALLQFDYDQTLHETSVNVLRRTLAVIRNTRDKLRARAKDLQALGEQLLEYSKNATIAEEGLSIPITDDADVDAWYERAVSDRTPIVRAFLSGYVKRSESRHESIEGLKTRVSAFAEEQFADLRTVTLAQIVAEHAGMASRDSITQKLKRFADFSAPLIEIRDIDPQAHRAMNRDTTIWLENEGASDYVKAVRHRLPDADVRRHSDSLSARGLSRVLHFPAYSMSQIDYFRAQYDPAQHPDTAVLADLIPAEFLLSPAVRAVYEHVLLARAVGLIRIREDGSYVVETDEESLGSSHLEIAERLATSEETPRRKRIESSLEPLLDAKSEVESGLRTLLEATEHLTSVDRHVLGALIRRYGTPF